MVEYCIDLLVENEIIVETEKLCLVNHGKEAKHFMSFMNFMVKKTLLIYKICIICGFIKSLSLRPV
jgi:hypothetical protein